MIELAHVAAIISLCGTALVFGTDAFCALVQRPALARVDDSTLTAVMGNVHRYGDKRMPVPGVIGLLFAAIAAVTGALAGNTPVLALDASTVVAWVTWLLIYARISAPINRQLIAAADAGRTAKDARDLQARWDAVIVLRATLLGIGLIALAVSLIA
jgi:hypothetical protein